MSSRFNESIRFLVLDVLFSSLPKHSESVIWEALPVVDIEQLMEYLKQRLESYSVKDDVERRIRSSDTKVKKEREAIFTAYHLCPAIDSFYSEDMLGKVNCIENEVKLALGTEGFDKVYKRLPRFGFTPARKKKHLFLKSDIVCPKYPRAWRTDSNKSLPRYQACPDFAIKTPLLLVSTLGEVNYFRSGTRERALTELYNVARQATFYLGAFNDEIDKYRRVLLVIADASPDHAFFQGLRLLKPSLRARFGEETNIHLLPLELR